ncbi:DUF952 domain-containing protein [Aestuariivirga sp.]|uniref:DUF952 domain-containing protein n=1 Tax=Aestuariivirga sp. TaxID=2650926 RepID=UPI00391DFA0F
MRFLYKILSAAEWREALAKGVFEGSAVDRKDGFIHLSAAHQVRETARRHFAGEADLVLVGFAEADLPALKWEPSRGGELFPHVYGPIATRLAVKAEPLPLEAGAHRFPEGIA